MAASKGKGFAGIQDAAQQSSVAPAAPSDEEQFQPETSESPDDDAKHPIYDARDGEHPDTGHAHLMHDLGVSLQEMMAKDPDTQKSMGDLMDQFMGKEVDYDAESKRLRGLIEARQTPKAPNWIAAGVGSWAGGPSVANKFSQLQQAATQGEAQKERDLETTQSKLLDEHVADLQRRGKTKEALLMGLMSGQMGQQKEETKQEGATDRAELSAETRRELQERSLGAAEQRVRIQVGGRKDVADKDRTAGQVMHLYESLLRQSEKDVTGATKPIYSAEEAMNMALNTILPKVKPGVETVKTGKVPAGAATPAAAPVVGQSKFAQWKAQQAAGKKPAGR